jgi:hypothetical protein
MSAYPKTPLAGAAVDRLKWLTGHWVGVEGETRIEEIWSPPETGIMMGSFRWSEADRPSFYEFMVIQPCRTGVELHIKHFGADLVGWEERERTVAFDLVQLDGREAVFLKRTPDEVRWMSYRFVADGRLEVQFQIEGEDSSAADLLRFERRSQAWPTAEKEAAR